jgi:hypothetical protein
MKPPSSLADCSETGAEVVRGRATALPNSTCGIGVSRLFLIPLLAIVTSTHAETLTIRGVDAALVSARAVAWGSKSEAQGTIGKENVVFDKLLPGERYDITLTARDARQLRLIDLSWYAPLPAAEPGPMTDEDRAAIEEILTGIKTFTNKNTMLHLVGNADRAVALVELVRDTDFHARKGDEIIWRIEVWFFEFQAGGWAKVQQQNRVVERERFKSAEAFEAHRRPLTWIGIEAGLQIQQGRDATLDLAGQLSKAK